MQPRENARTHMDSLNMALALQERVGVETIATVTTWDKTIMSLQADLLGAHALGIRSVVSTTGSPPVYGDYPAVDGTWEVDSVGLTALLAGLNAGRDSNGLALTSRTSFCIGARINPAARDHGAELARARAKIRAGAQFLVCRPVYELDALTRLVEELDGTGVPLLLSVAPLSSFEEADYLAHEVPGVTIPGSTLDAMERAGRSGGRAVGLELAANLLTKARPLVSGVILAAPGDDPAALAPLLDALGLIARLPGHKSAKAWDANARGRTDEPQGVPRPGRGRGGRRGRTVSACSGIARPGSRPSAATARRWRNPVPENSLPGASDWVIRHLGAEHEIEGYPGKASVLAGEPLPLFVSTTARAFTVTAYRLGWYQGHGARQLWKSKTVRGGAQRAATVSDGTSTVATDWDPVLTLPTDDWPAGAYLLKLSAESGAQRYVPVTVRSPSCAGKVVLKACVQTWQAYNMWGGYDLYKGPNGAYADRSLVVSLDRPYGDNGANMFLTYERNVVKLAEFLTTTRGGLDLAYVTSMDIDADPRLLDGASALISLGHDEYWTPAERANVTAARDKGVNLAFFGANAHVPQDPPAGVAGGGGAPGGLLQDRLPRRPGCTGRTPPRSPATGATGRTPTRSRR